MKRRPNERAVFWLLALVVVFATLAHFVHSIQIQRNAHTHEAEPANRSSRHAGRRRLTCEIDSHCILIEP